VDVQGSSDDLTDLRRNCIQNSSKINISSKPDLPRNYIGMAKELAQGLLSFSFIQFIANFTAKSLVFRILIYKNYWDNPPISIRKEYKKGVVQNGNIQMNINAYKKSLPLELSGTPLGAGRKVARRRRDGLPWGGTTWGMRGYKVFPNLVFFRE
jgi:hypothetical protein